MSRSEQGDISPDYWQGLKPCRECGAPLLNSYPPERARGSYWHPDVPLSPYEAVNLLEALKVVKDTGDWHGQLRYRCEAVLRFYGNDEKPNAQAGVGVAWRVRALYFDQREGGR